jgi:serpin B
LDFKNDANREAARQMINAAIEKQTKDKIKELLHPGDLTKSTRLVLTNAIYFKGQWIEAFDKQSAKDAPFTLTNGTEKNVPLMAMQRHLHYLESSEFQAVELPY